MDAPAVLHNTLYHGLASNPQTASTR